MEHADNKNRYRRYRSVRACNGRQQGYYNKNWNDNTSRYKPHFQPKDNRPFYKRYPNKKILKNTSRSTSPVIGSEEYMTQKIQKTSAIIMRHLLTPEDNVIPLTLNNPSTSKATENDTCTAGVSEQKNERKRTRSVGQTESVNKKASYDVADIHNKIMNHISNLNNGRKKNLISTSTSIYDEAIDQIVKQKRLEISRALRNVCNETPDITESTDWINSIIPDIGIKIEDLPKEILQELQISFSNQDNLQSFQDKSPEPEKDSPSDVMIKIEDSPVEVVEILPSDINTGDFSNEQLVEQQNEIVEYAPVQMEDEGDVVVLQPDVVETIIVDDEPVPNGKKSKITIEQLLNKNFKSKPKNMKEIKRRMLVIDGYINELTTYRQNLFNTKNSKKKNKKKATRPVEVINKESSNVQQKLLNFETTTEKMLVLKICEDKLIAGTESGKILLFSLEDAQCLNVIQVTEVPIACLHYTKAEEQGKPYMFVGSFESHLKVYNFHSMSLVKDIFIDDSVQCMDENWGYLFVGCMRGTILRYSIKKNVVEFEEQFDRDPIFVLKATQEGARKVLLIGSRNSSVLIRDAMNGLHLRTMGTIMCPTVYCIIMDKHFVYCGTTSLDILIFNFHNGALLKRYNASNSKGIGCMKIVGKCLFASCHNGQVYVYNLVNDALVGTLTGPGGVILSMEVLKDQVLVGTMSCKFSSIPIPFNISSQM